MVELKYITVEACPECGCADICEETTTPIIDEATGFGILNPAERYEVRCFACGTYVEHSNKWPFGPNEWKENVSVKHCSNSVSAATTREERLYCYKATKEYINTLNVSDEVKQRFESLIGEAV